MPFLINQLIRGCLLLCSSVVIAPALIAQCNPPGQLPSSDCATAPLICLLNACYTLTDTPGSGPQGWCGTNTVINNPQYFKFIASADYVEIQIHVDFCDISGQGMQAGILGACPWENFDVMDCDEGTPAGGTIILSSDLVIPGEMYWLLIDGINGLICDYTISYVEGIEQFDIPGELEESETYANPAVLCQESDIAFFITGPPLEEAHGYYWVFSWAPTDTFTTTDNYLYRDIPSGLAPGEYSFCVRAFNGCDTTNAVCNTYTMATTDTIDKQSVLCPELFPFAWGNIIIEGPGTYQETFADTAGCTDTIWMIETYPEQPIDTITQVICDESIQPGYYPLIYPGANIYGCDSIDVLNIIRGEIDAFVEVNCESGEFVLHAIIEDLGNPNDQLSYAWYPCDYSTQLGDGSTFITDVTGCYCLITTGLYCQDTVCVTVTEETCLEKCGLVDEYYCEGEAVEFTLPWAVSEDAEIYWNIYEKDQLIETVQGVTTFTRVLDPYWYSVALTVIDSGMTTACLEYFTVESLPIASICCDMVTCDSCAYITVQANDVVNITLLDQFGSPYVLLGIPGIADIEICPQVFPYTLTVVAVSGTYSECIGEPALPDQLTISGSPEIIIQQAGETLCIEADNPLSVKWHACTDTITLATSLCFAPAADGCYCVTITDANGCIKSDCYDFITHIQDAIEAGFTFFPNPSSDAFLLTIPDHISLPVEWILYDNAGKTVSNGKLNERESHFKWPEHAVPGNYQMVIKDDDKAYRLSLVRMGE